MSIDTVTKSFYACEDGQARYQAAMDAKADVKYFGSPRPTTLTVSGMIQYAVTPQTFTCGASTSYKLQTSLPNTGLLDLKTFRITGDVNLSYVWAGTGADPGYAAVAPAICRSYNSLIERNEVYIGSREVLIEDRINTYNSYQQNFRNSAVNTYSNFFLPYGGWNNDSKPFTSAADVRHFEIYPSMRPTSFFNRVQNELLPLDQLGKVSFNFVFAAANNCCWCASAYSAATVVLTLTYSNVQFEFQQVAFPIKIPMPLALPYTSYAWMSDTLTALNYTFQIPSRFMSLRNGFMIFRDSTAIGNITGTTGQNQLRLGSSQITGISRVSFRINNSPRWAQDIVDGRMLLQEFRNVFQQSLSSDWATSLSSWPSTQLVVPLNFSTEYSLITRSGTNSSRQNSNATINIIFTNSSGTPFSPALQMDLFLEYDSLLRMSVGGEVMVDQ